MSIDYMHSSLFGSPLQTSSRPRNKVKSICVTQGKHNVGGFFSFLPLYHCQKLQGFDRFSYFGVGKVEFSRRNPVSKSRFRINCIKEPFSRSKALFRSFVPLWKEGLFLVRCSVFFTVISAVGMLVWYAQLKAVSFVESRLLPSVCSVLSEYLQRELDFGRVRSVSPLGITLTSCSIGPHREEFSCGEVSVMKLRLRPFASLRRGKIVIDAILYQPSILVAQKENFSWLGIPSPSVNGILRHHSSEEGIDYRTKTRRLAREESAACWARERVEKAKHAAEIGYIVPHELPAYATDNNFKDISDRPLESVRSDLLLCMDDMMHQRDHHCMDSGIEYDLKHADLEKSFGVKVPGSGLKSWFRMISKPIRRKFKRESNRKSISKAGITSKERVLRHSAAAALAYFQDVNSRKSSRSNTEQGSDPSDGGNGDTGGEGFTVNEEVPGHANMTLLDMVNKHESTDALDEVHIANDKFECSLLSSNNNTKVPERSLSNPYNPNDGYMEEFRLTDHHHGVCYDDLQVPLLELFDESAGISRYIACQSSTHGKFWPSMRMHHSTPIYPTTWKTTLLQLSKTVTERLPDQFHSQLQKLKSCFIIKFEELAAELANGTNGNSCEGIQKLIPISLDSVQFTGGTLMLLAYGDIEPRAMVNADGHVKFQNHYGQIHVQLNGDCLQWRSDSLPRDGGHLSTDVFVDGIEQKWHANLKIANLFAPLFERILEIPLTLSRGRASGEVHICMSKGDTFPNLHGQLDVNGLAFQLLDAPSCFSEVKAGLCFRGQRIFLHNANGWFGDAPLEASGDFGINPENGELHLMCQVPCIEVNALMRTLKMRPLIFPLAGSVTAVFNCQGPLDAPVFVGSGMISRKTSNSVTMPPSSASEAVIKNKEAGAVAAIDRIPFSHVSANFTFNLDNSVADLYGIRASLLDGGEIRGAGNAWICPEGEVDDSALDINLSGHLLFEKVMNRYLPSDILLTPLKIGELNGETKLSGSLLRPRFDIKWAAPQAEDSFADSRGHIVISHDCMTVASSSIAFELFTKVQTSYPDDYWSNRKKVDFWRTMPLVVETVDLDLRMRGFEFASLISSGSFGSPRPLHLKGTGKIRFQGKVVKYDANDIHNVQMTDDEKTSLVGEVSLSGIKLNQLMLAPQLAGSLCVSHNAVKLAATGRPDENLSVEVIEPLWFTMEHSLQKRRLMSVSLQKGQLRANISYQPEHYVNLEKVRQLPLDELELASLRGSVQRAELELNYQKRRGHGLLSVLHPKFSGVRGETLDVAARWSGDVITIEKTVLEQTSSRYELQGEYVLPRMRERHPADNRRDGFFKKAMAGHLGRIISSMGRWRMRLEVPGAEVSEMLPLARLLSRSTDPAVRSRSKVKFYSTN
ncbi:hypothetical protein DsansV1_C04g0049581 [Dioscorea sansibarensis]